MCERVTVCVYVCVCVCEGFFQDFRQEGANATIVELRGGIYYSFFQGFCQRECYTTHTVKLGGAPLEKI